MSQKKKQIRDNFRNEVFSRDKNCCLKCGEKAVDAHHITDRNEMPNGGYVKENAIEQLKQNGYYQVGGESLAIAELIDPKTLEEKEDESTEELVH